MCELEFPGLNVKSIISKLGSVRKFKSRIKHLRISQVSSGGKYVRTIKTVTVLTDKEHTQRLPCRIYGWETRDLKCKQRGLEVL